MNLSKKGQSSLIDILLLSTIIVIAIAFLHIYSITHMSTNSKNLKDALGDEYASRVLMALSYVNARDAGYDTVQAHAVTNVSDQDLSTLVQASLKLRNYTSHLDQTLENWSENLTRAHDQAKTGMEDIRKNISDLRDELAKEKDSLTSSLSAAEANCAGLTDALNKYADIVGLPEIFPDGDPCGYVKEMGSVASGTYESVDGKLTELDEKITEAESYLDTDQAKLSKVLQEARCILKETDVKNDVLISYAQLGVKQDTTLLDLFPARASLETKTVTETIGESLYVEDRLAQSDTARMLGAAGVRILLSENGIGLGDTKSQITQAAALTFARKEYRELAQKSVESSLHNMLTKQGYAYCFKAENCCNKVTAGICDKVPDNAARAKRSIQAFGNETAEMTLDIWKQ